MKTTALLLAVSAIIVSSAFCSETFQPITELTTVAVPLAANDQPGGVPYEFGCTDGLYATIVGALSPKGIKING